MSNVYYNPEKFGLEEIAEIDFSDGCYQFDYLTIWKGHDGSLYYAEDSGCSCPSPFEGFGLPDLTRVQNEQEIFSRIEWRISEMSEWEASEIPRLKQELMDLKSKLRRTKFGLAA